VRLMSIPGPDALDHRLSATVTLNHEVPGPQ
jgi:hypothetical protein